MLPIRLGMANSQGTQDMIVYAFTKTGRVECTNYRTTKMPTDRKVPLFIKDQFGDLPASCPVSPGPLCTVASGPLCPAAPGGGVAFL